MKPQKHLFSLDPAIHYLNCGYKAPLLKSAEAAGIKALERERNPTLIKPSDFFEGVQEVRVRFGDLVNCYPSEIAIVPSTSYGFKMVLNNITCTPGQHALVLEDEFPSGYFAIKSWSDQNQAEIRTVGPDKGLDLIGENWNKKILDNINEKTAVVLLSSIHWMNGLKFDLEKIGEKCKAFGAKFIVDGTQSVGAAEMDVKKYQIDALICASYKWLFGPYSLALAYLGEGFNNGRPLEESWLNRTNAENFGNLTDYDPNYGPNATRYNVGEMSNFILMPILNEALKQIQEWTVSGIENYCRRLNRPLRQYLKDLGVQCEDESHVSHHLFALKLPPKINLDSLKRNLESAGIFLSVRGNYLRVSVHVFNTEDDISSLIEVLEKTRIEQTNF